MNLTPSSVFDLTPPSVFKLGSLSPLSSRRDGGHTSIIGEMMRRSITASIKVHRLSFVLKAFLLIAFVFPLAAHAQEGGCINADTIYVPVNTVLPTVNATPANFTCNGSYTYQWFVSTDNSHFTEVGGATGQNLNYTQPITSLLIFFKIYQQGCCYTYIYRLC